MTPMPRKLDYRDPDFATAFAALVATGRGVTPAVGETVRDIIASVRRDGDQALADLTRRFDHIDLDTLPVRLDPDEIARLDARTPPDLRAALDMAATRIRAFHARSLPQDDARTDDAGLRSGWRWSPISAVGLYVPGGRASYPSSVLMNAIPAKIAGVTRLAMTTPTPHGEINPLVISAARLAGVDEIYRIGGAQAIAALAYGTPTIPPVDKIVGPGNAYVAEAKRQVFGHVGIDMVAGPSEIVIVADADNDPEHLAADLMSQAEHDPTAQAILITDDDALIAATLRAVEALIPRLSTRSSARASWDDYGAIIRLDSLDQALPLVDALAPEHLELAVENPADLFARIQHAGSVFLGRHTPEAIGDYLGGPNHVLPTGRRARFSSGLSVVDFMKRTTFLQCDEAALTHVGPATIALAEAEGLPAHAESVRRRLERKGN